jgi:hypothetical protein
LQVSVTLIGRSWRRQATLQFSQCWSVSPLLPLDINLITWPKSRGIVELKTRDLEKRVICHNRLIMEVVEVLYKCYQQQRLRRQLAIGDDDSDVGYQFCWRNRCSLAAAPQVH